jgi:hypothetical protein
MHCENHTRTLGRALGLLSAGLLLAACLSSSLATAQSYGTGGNAAYGQYGAYDVPDSVKLQESDVTSFISAVTDLQALNKKYGGGLKGDASQAKQWADGLAANADAMSILKRNGFADVERFTSVAYSVMMARAAGEMEGQQAEMDAAEAKLEAMKSQMSAAQYEMIKQQMLGAMQMFDDQPAGNVELVEKYASQIDALDN